MILLICCKSLLLIFIIQSYSMFESSYVNVNFNENKAFDC